MYLAMDNLIAMLNFVESPVKVAISACLLQATWGNNNYNQPGSPSKLFFNRINMSASLGLINLTIKGKEKQNM